MRLYVFILIIVVSSNLFSQENLVYEKNFSAYQGYFTEKFGIICTIPKAFEDLNQYYVMWKVRNEPSKHTGSMYGPIFLSTGKECIIAYPALLSYFSVESKDNIKRMKLPFYPRSQILNEIRTSLGLFNSPFNLLNKDAVRINFDDYVTIIAGKHARDMFNADSVYLYDLPHADSVYFFDESLEKMRKGKYPYCSGMFTYKRNRATMDVKFFFTEEGKKKQDEYIRLMGKHIWYDERFKHE